MMIGFLRLSAMPVATLPQVYPLQEWITSLARSGLLALGRGWFCPQAPTDRHALLLGELRYTMVREGLMNARSATIAVDARAAGQVLATCGTREPRRKLRPTAHSRKLPLRCHSAALSRRSGSIPNSRLTWANFAGSARRLSAIICRRAIIPVSVKKSRGIVGDVSRRIRPRSTKLLAGGGSLGWPFCGPPRQILS